MSVLYKRIGCWLLLACSLLLTSPARAQVLELQLSGLEGQLRDNTLAWLGDLPEDPRSRANFLYSARERVEHSLQVLGYYQPVIDLQLDRSNTIWRLEISVEPGEPVHLRTVDIELKGDALTDPAFLELLLEPGMAPGDVLNHEVYEQLKRRMSALGSRRGYFDARFAESRVKVEPVGGTADLRILYDSGIRYAFGELNFDQSYLEESLLEPLIEIEPGEPFDQARLQQTQAALQRTGYFSTIVLRPQPQLAEDGRVPLEMGLYRARRHSFDVGIGWSTDTEERVSLTWRTPRLNRYGHSQETRVQLSSVNPSGRITYSIPLSHPLNDLLQLSARVEDNEFGDLDSHQKELAVRRELKRNGWVYGYGLRGLTESWSTKGFRRENDYLLPGVSFSKRQRSGSLVNPSAGFSQWYRSEVGNASLGSDIDVVRVLANFGYIASFGTRHRMVLRSDLGIALLDDRDREDLAPSLSFFAGGSQSIRGYSYQSIGNEIEGEDENGEEITLVVGGDRLLTASAEYQYSFDDTWRGAVFVDAGDAFDEGEFDTNVGLGVGVHYVTAVGAIRLEVANPVTKDDPSWRFHLAVGAEF